jgi:hypothetical protein
MGLRHPKKKPEEKIPASEKYASGGTTSGSSGSNELNLSPESNPPATPGSGYAHGGHAEAEHARHDEAAERLRQQIAALDHEQKRKEQVEAIGQAFRQRAHQLMQHGVPAHLIHHGIQIAGQQATQEGLDPNSPKHGARTAHHFEQLIQHHFGQQAAPQPAPTPLAPPPAAPSVDSVAPPVSPPERPFAALHQEPEDGSGRYSAPVSRESGVSIGGSRTGGGRQIRLSAEEREIARSVGMSDVDYAHNKHRLEEEKRRGLRQNG